MRLGERKIKGIPFFFYSWNSSREEKWRKGRNGDDPPQKVKKQRSMARLRGKYVAFRPKYSLPNKPGCYHFRLSSFVYFLYFVFWCVEWLEEFLITDATRDYLLSLIETIESLGFTIFSGNFNSVLCFLARYQDSFFFF